MSRYILGRLAFFVPVVVIVSMVVFALIRIVPGDVVDLMMENLATGGERGAERAAADRLRQDLGLDKPIPLQYATYMGDLLHGDLGESAWTGRTVRGEIKKALPISLELTAVAMVIALLVSLPLGILSAIRQDSWLDNIARVVAILGLSLPSFWTGTLIVVFMARWWGYSVPLEYASPFAEPWVNFQKIIFPAAVLGAVLAGTIARMVRSSLLEVLRQDYIRTALAKGLRERMVVLRHALKNAMIPVITIMGLQFGTLLGGTVIVETIFTLPGMGRLTVTAIQRRDYPILQGTVLVFATTLLLMNLIVDILYSWLDPRIKYG